MEARAFCASAGVELDAIPASTKLARLKLISDAVELLISPDERKRSFFRHVSAATRAYKALLPDDKAAPYFKQVATLHVLAEAVRGKLGPVDISAIYARIEALLDERIEGVAITAPIVDGDGLGERVDLSDIDFEALASLFKKTPKTANDQLRDKAEKKAREMAGENSTRKDLVERLEALVSEYNSGTLDAEKFFEELKSFIERLKEEELRAAREGLTERELAIFDLLTRPSPKLTKAQEISVKAIAKSLLTKLQSEHLSAFWERHPETRAAVQSEIKVILNQLPEEPYPEDIFDAKCEAVWQYVYHHMAGAGAVAS